MASQQDQHLKCPAGALKNYIQQLSAESLLIYTFKFCACSADISAVPLTPEMDVSLHRTQLSLQTVTIGPIEPRCLIKVTGEGAASALPGAAHFYLLLSAVRAGCFVH